MAWLVSDGSLIDMSYWLMVRVCWSRCPVTCSVWVYSLVLSGSGEWMADLTIFLRMPVSVLRVSTARDIPAEPAVAPPEVLSTP